MNARIGELNIFTTFRKDGFAGEMMMIDSKVGLVLRSVEKKFFNFNPTAETTITGFRHMETSVLEEAHRLRKASIYSRFQITDDSRDFMVVDGEKGLVLDVNGQVGVTLDPRTKITICGYMEWTATGWKTP